MPIFALLEEVELGASDSGNVDDLDEWEWDGVDTGTEGWPCDCSVLQTFLSANYRECRITQPDWSFAATDATTLRQYQRNSTGFR